MNYKNVRLTEDNYQDRLELNDLIGIEDYCEELETEAETAETLKFLDLQFDIECFQLAEIAKTKGKAMATKKLGKIITNYKQNVRRAVAKVA
jgi:hypothetical protein|tara:strand:- start:54 stop:329 length:276 start_codon:yes stop_codon:yes gene_type:complete